MAALVALLVPVHGALSVTVALLPYDIGDKGAWVCHRRNLDF